MRTRAEALKEIQEKWRTAEMELGRLEDQFHNKLGLFQSNPVIRAYREARESLQQAVEVPEDEREALLREDVPGFAQIRETAAGRNGRKKCTLTYWQALGILVLSRILFGGFPGRRGGPFGPPWRSHMMMKRWESLTPEQREKMREDMRQRFGDWPKPPWCDAGHDEEQGPDTPKKA